MFVRVCWEWAVGREVRVIVRMIVVKRVFIGGGRGRGFVYIFIFLCICYLMIIIDE